MDGIGDHPRREASDPSSSGCEVDRLRQAIDALSAVEAGEPSLELECALIWLRRRLGEALRASPPAAAGDRTFVDPWPELRARPPEVRPAGLGVDQLGGAIRHHGCLLIRGLVDPTGVARLAGGLDRAFDERDRGKGRAAPTPYRADLPGEGGRELAVARALVAKGGGVWAAEAPRLLAELLAEYRRVGLLDVIGGYLGEPPVLSVEKTTLRRVPPDKHPSWHQDGSFMGEGLRSVNVWLALSECGEGTDAPGLAIVPRRLDDIAEVGTRGAKVHNAVGPGVVEDLSVDAPVLHPHFAAGDALVFDDVFLHATGTEPGQVRTRLAIEAWFFTASRFPDAYLPLAV